MDRRHIDREAGLADAPFALDEHGSTGAPCRLQGRDLSLSADEGQLARQDRCGHLAPPRRDCQRGLVSAQLGREGLGVGHRRQPQFLAQQFAALAVLGKRLLAAPEAAEQAHRRPVVAFLQGVVREQLLEVQERTGQVALRFHGLGKGFQRLSSQRPQAITLLDQPIGEFRRIVQG
ncbi:MAG: hypothetical protein OEW22_05070, partial [Rubrivivax sp.]|nr:hypothetical protein [Rubrivivax sp.]